MKNFLPSLFIAFIFSHAVNAQPGPMDLSNDFFYTIVDQNGKEISFQNDSTYQIRIDGKLQTTLKSSFQSDSISPVFADGLTDTAFILNYRIRGYPISTEFCWDVEINDFNIRYVPKIIEDHQFEVQIIHGTDTMHLFQESRAKRPLQFIPGYYYFPDWSGTVLEGLPETSGAVRLLNIDQRNFIVSKEQIVYDIYARDDREKLDELIANRFIDNFYTVEKKMENSDANLSFAPYAVEGFRSMFPTKKDGIYIGTIGYNTSYSNYSSSNQVVCLFNRKENKIEYKSPKDSMDLFFCSNLFIDTFNQVYYQTVGTREYVNYPSCLYNSNGECAYKLQTLRSSDQGETWTEDKPLSALFNQFRYFKLDFLDKNYVVASVRIENFTKQKGHSRQALYYLVRNGKIVDSLRSPEFFHYQDDYHNGVFQLEADSVILGQWWTTNNDKTPRAGFTPMAVKVKDKWKLYLSDYKQHYASWNNRKIVTKEYSTLKITNEHILEFNHGSFAFKPGTRIVSQVSDYGVYIYEYENQVYLLSESTGCTWFSLDKGKSWYFYPKPLDEFNSEYGFVEMENDSLAVFNSRDLRKVFYKFTPLNQ